VRRAAALALAATALASPAAGQEGGRVTTSQAAWWLQYFGDHRLGGGRVALLLDLQARRRDVAAEPAQVLLRGAGVYTLSPVVRLGAGYAFAQTWPPDDVEPPASFPEHRLFEAMYLLHDAGRVQFRHRYFLEQRWLGRMAVDSATGDARVSRWDFLLRARYQLRLNVLLNRPTLGPGTVYAYGGDELFVAFGAQAGPNLFDQNRLFTGLGWQFARHLRAEVGYVNQLIVRPSGQRVDVNHTLVTQLVSVAPLF